VVQKQPKHAKWRTQHFRHYDECALINEHTMATGENTFSSGVMGGSQGHSTATIDIDYATQGAFSEKESDKDDSDFESDLTVISQSALTQVLCGSAVRCLSTICCLFLNFS
jgi:hypothetical protein